MSKTISLNVVALHLFVQHKRHHHGPRPHQRPRLHGVVAESGFSRIEERVKIDLSVSIEMIPDDVVRRQKFKQKNISLFISTLHPR